MGNLIKTPYSEVTATLEILAALGVTSEHLARLRTDPKHAKQVADALISFNIETESVFSSIGSGIVCVTASGKFIASDYFTTKSEIVKIGWMGSDFKQWFLPKVEEAQAEASLRLRILQKKSLDIKILAELGDKAETTLAKLWKLLEKQSSREGVSLTKSCTNIFYVRDFTGELRVVYVYWRDIGWFINSSSVSVTDEWSDNNRVFSRA